MAEFPALPLFTDALVADTAHLTDEEFGAYIRLLILEWRTAECKLPADAAWHMRRLGVNSDKYNSLHGPLISEFFETDGNHLFQKRLLKEFRYLREQSKKQSDRAKLRWNKQNTSSHGNATSGNAPHPTPPKKVRESKASLTYAPEFLEFWGIYPRKDGSKMKASESYQRAIKEGADHGTIITAVRTFADHARAFGVVQTKIAHATTWLNQHRWEADYSARPPEGSASRNADLFASGNAEGHAPKRSKWQVEAERIAAKYDAEAQRERQEEAGASAGENLPVATAIWQNGS